MSLFHPCMMSVGGVQVCRCLMLWISLSTCLSVHAQVLTLQNEHLQIGVLPNCGGRLVQFQPVEGVNLIDSNPTLWDTDDASQWRPVFGHVIWVGPQSRWHERPPRNWPPDLALVMGRYEITEKSNTAITLRSSSNSEWGLELTKQYTLKEQTLHLAVTARNVAEHDLRWDLWSNTRWHPDGRGYVPMGSNRTVQLQYRALDPLTYEAPTHRIVAGWFSFDQPVISKPGNKSWAKAMIEPAQCLMVYQRDQHVVLQQTQPIHAGRVSSGHSPVEVYVDHGQNLLEMEFHSQVHELSPGQTMSLNQTWQYRHLKSTTSINDLLQSLSVR